MNDQKAGKDTRFKPGKSGNPNGRKAGARSKALLALDAAIGKEDAEAIIKAMVDKAKDGDAVAARTILDRVWPVRRGARLSFELPDVNTANDLPAAIGAIGRQVAAGEISPDEGAAVVSLLDAHRKAIETSDIAARLTALEERIAGK